MKSLAPLNATAYLHIVQQMFQFLFIRYSYFAAADIFIYICVHYVNVYSHLHFYIYIYEPASPSMMCIRYGNKDVNTATAQSCEISRKKRKKGDFCCNPLRAGADVWPSKRYRIDHFSFWKRLSALMCPLFHDNVLSFILKLSFLAFFIGYLCTPYKTANKLIDIIL